MKHLYSKIRTSYIDYIVIAIIVILSGILRFIPLLRGDVPFLFDQGRDMMAVKDIIVGHKLTLIGPFTGLQGVFQGPWHFYLLAIPFILTKGNLFAEYGMMIIVSLLGIILCYVIGKSISSRLFGVLLAVFFAFSPASVSVSTYFWNPNWIPFLMVIFYYFLYKSIFISNKNWPLTALVVGFIAQFEVAFGLPLFIILFILAVLFRSRSLRSIYFWSIIPVFLATFLPQIFFDMRHQFLMTKAIISFLHGANGGTGATIYFPERLFKRINEIQQATIFSVSNNRIISYFLSIPLFIFLTSALSLKMKKDLKLFFLFLSVPILFFCMFLFYSHEAWSWYWVGLQTSYYFLLAFALSQLPRQFRLGSILSVLCIGLWIVTVVIPDFVFLPKTSVGDTGTLKNELRVIDTIYRDAQGKQFGEFVYTPPIYDYAYQYLFWWKGTSQYHYVSTKDKTGIFYLIIEPDKERPYAINGWKETVIKTGRVVWDKTLPGNITIEKRDGGKV